MRVCETLNWVENLRNAFPMLSDYSNRPEVNHYSTALWDSPMLKAIPF